MTTFADRLLSLTSPQRSILAAEYCDFFLVDYRKGHIVYRFEDDSALIKHTKTGMWEAARTETDPEKAGEIIDHPPSVETRH